MAVAREDLLSIIIDDPFINVVQGVNQFAACHCSRKLEPSRL
jgi:hypothetical protein